MPLVLGIDLGTSTVTVLALDPETGKVVAAGTVPTSGETTSPADKARGFCEWDVTAIAAAACQGMKRLVRDLPQNGKEVSGIGLTGQQHGVVMVDEHLKPLTPFINWQDRRMEETYPGSRQTCTKEAQQRLGAEACRRTGCTMAAGYLGGTLFWLKSHDVLPAKGTACFLTDYFGALLTGTRPITEPTNAAGSGLFDVARGDWAFDLVDRLGLPRERFPEVMPSGTRLGGLQRSFAEATGLREGIAVFSGIGDNQASFLGSVANRADSVLVNVGTGGQVTAFRESFLYDPQLETRPFPRGGNLLVCAGLCGGRAYALLQDFFAQVGGRFFQVSDAGALYQKMNELAAAVPEGAEGLQCEPYFTGTHAHPDWRGSLTGLSPANFTPGHLTRALLEGMARAFRTGYEAVLPHLDKRSKHLVGAGNGLRENPLLAGIVARTLDLPLQVPVHREEAAYGAALLAAVGAGFFPDLVSAGSLIRFE